VAQIDGGALGATSWGSWQKRYPLLAPVTQVPGRLESFRQNANSKSLSITRTLDDALRNVLNNVARIETASNLIVVFVAAVT